MSQPTLKNVRKVQDIYDMKSVLGTGGYAVVWSATHKATKEEFAIKVMKATASSTPKDDEVTVDEIRNEIEVMKKLEHPNVIYVKEYFVQSGKFYIVMSCLKGGELLDALLDLGNYTEEDAKCISKQLLDALVARSDRRDDADGGDHHRDEAVHEHQEHARGEHLRQGEGQNHRSHHA